MTHHHESPETFVEILLKQQEQASNLTAILELENGREEGGRVTYGELVTRASRFAATLKEFRKEAVLIMLPSGLDFALGFYGCLLAGAIGVPLYPPSGTETLSQRLVAVARDCQARAVITSVHARAEVAQAFESMGTTAPRVFTLEGLEQGSTSCIEKAAPQDIAFLQYTSGSTSAPKGVIVTHANLVDNVRRLDKTHDLYLLAPEEQLRFVSWLPMFHDMGMIGKVLQPCYHAGISIVMPPRAFVRSPIVWLEAISKYSAHYSMSPNFGYDACVARLPRHKTEHLDLSSWRLAVNGSEPVSHRTLVQFAKRFAENGLRATALSPGYGLAEATLCVTGYKTDAPFRWDSFDPESLANGEARISKSSSARTLVASGEVLDPAEVMVVDEETTEPLPEGKVGEIWISNGSVAAGYWHNEEATSQAFGGPPRGRSDAGYAYLRSGDLGFIWDRHLYVVGRSKDLIILNGQNIYPQDIEQTVQASNARLRGYVGAAFPIELEGKEHLAIVQSAPSSVLRDEMASLDAAQEIKKAVYKREGVPIRDVVLVGVASIARTSSGKVRRAEMKQRYLRGEFRTAQATVSS